MRTYGCQMNEHDSERIAGLLEADGLVPAASEDDADVVVLNTCCIRENADNKLYGNLGHLKTWKAGARGPPDRGVRLPRPEGPRRRRASGPATSTSCSARTTSTAPPSSCARRRRDGPLTEILEAAVLDDHALFPSALPARRDHVATTRG